MDRSGAVFMVVSNNLSRFEDGWGGMVSTGCRLRVLPPAAVVSFDPWLGTPQSWEKWCDYFLPEGFSCGAELPALIISPTCLRVLTSTSRIFPA